MEVEFWIYHPASLWRNAGVYAHASEAKMSVVLLRRVQAIKASPWSSEHVVVVIVDDLTNKEGKFAQTIRHPFKGHF